MFKPPWWFQCWLLLAVLSDDFGHLVTSTFLLWKFRGLPGSTLVIFPIMSRWKCLGVKRSSQPSSTTPGKRAEKTCQSESRCEASNAKSRKSLFHLKPGRVKKFEYCNNLWKQNNFHNSVRKLNEWLKNNLQHCYVYANLYVNLIRERINCYKSLPKHKTIIEDLDNIIQDCKTVRLGL